MLFAMFGIRFGEPQITSPTHYQISKAVVGSRQFSHEDQTSPIETCLLSISYLHQQIQPPDSPELYIIH